MKFSRLFLATITLSLGLFSVSCQKEGCTDQTATNYDSDAKKDDGSCDYADSEGTLMFHIHSKVGSEDFAYETTYTDENGRSYEFTRVQFYLSEIHAHNATGEVPTGNEVIIVDPAVEMYNLGEIAPGSYTSYGFGIGVDEANNHEDPATFKSGSPLAPQSPSMNWSWASGYKFVVLEGNVDTNEVADGVLDAGFVFHVGTDDLYRSVSVSENFEVLDDQTTEIHMTIDISKFFEGVDLRTENSTHTMNNVPLAEKVANNGPSLFE